MVEHEILWKRMQDIYPFGYALAKLISIKYTQIYKDVLPDSELAEGETRSLSFNVGLDDKGDPRLAVSPSSMILFTAIAEAMLEVVFSKLAPDKNLEEIEKGFIHENKVCAKHECGTVNKITDEYCQKCGTKL